MYKSLNDAAKLFPELSDGSTEIWYQIRNDINFSFELPTKVVPGVTHKLLGRIRETNLGTIYYLLQGDNWSPEGEARELIMDKGLRHTSTSVGDVIRIDGKWIAVDGIGFKEISETV